MEIIKKYKYEIYLLALSIAAFILHIHLASTLNLGNDEAHYFVWSLKPSLGYLDDAPLVAYIIYLSTHLFSVSEFSVRFGAVVFSFLDGLLVYYLSYLLFKSKRASFFAFLFFLAAPIFSMALSVMMLPDAPLLFFYLCFLVIFYKAIAIFKTSKSNSNAISKSNLHTASIWWWILTGIMLGLAFISKYTAALIPPVALLYLLASKQNRFLLKTVYPYVALAIAILVFSPVIYWNAVHNFISFRFQLSHGFSSPKPGGILFLQGFLGQLLVISPFIYIFLTGVFIYSILYLFKKIKKNGIVDIKDLKTISENKESILYALFMSAPLLLFFIINGYSHRILVHWPDIGYLSAFPLMGFVADAVIKDIAEKRPLFKILVLVKYFIYFSLFTGFFLSFILYNQIYYNSIPVGKIVKYIDRQKRLKKGGIFNMIPHIPGKASTADITDDLFGWRHGAHYIGIIYRGYKIAYPSLFILTHHYAIADELIFYGHYKVNGNVFNISNFLNQYDLWQNLRLINGKDALFIMDNKYMINPYKAYEKYFKSIKKIGTLDIQIRFRPVRIYYLYLMKGFNCRIAKKNLNERMY